TPAARSTSRYMMPSAVEDLARFLGIAVGEQLHRALEVGEQDGHLLPFPFERGPGGENELRPGRVLVPTRPTRPHRSIPAPPTVPTEGAAAPCSSEAGTPRIRRGTPRETKARSGRRFAGPAAWPPSCSSVGCGRGSRDREAEHARQREATHGTEDHDL